MNKFEVVSAYADKGINIPTRATYAAAGYDFEVAEDVIVPAMDALWRKALTGSYVNRTMTLSDIAYFTKDNKVKPTLVPTGIKCQLASDCYLELSVRSSTPLKHWLILANSVGIIDGDYYNNPDNEGHIYFQLINLSPFDIQLKKGDKIGQGIIKKFEVTDDDYEYEKKERTGGFGSTNTAVANTQLTFEDVIIPDTEYTVDINTVSAEEISLQLKELQDSLYQMLAGAKVRG